ncbi:VanZ family protein [Ideonella livida]|nr:VanZ family protein [Ideonella livida]
MSLTQGWRGLLVLALAGGYVFALLPPGPPGPDWFWQADKVRHAAAFVAFWWMARRCGWPAPRVLAVLLAYGVAIEVGQAFTPGRDPSLGDVLADAVGLALGVWRWPPVRPAT